MRIIVNLASHPFEDRDSIFRRWIVITVAIALITVGLIALSIFRWRDARSLNQQYATAVSQKERLEKERAQYQVVLDQGRNRATRERAELINELILRKQFAWTSIFSELERILPPTVRVTAIHPSLVNGDQLAIQLTVASQSAEGPINFIRRIEDSKQFRNPQLLSERHATKTSDNTGEANAGPAEAQYQISALYIPPPETAPQQNGEPPQ